MKKPPDPSFKYSGLTVVLDRPSRFDIQSRYLISGRAGDWFDSCLLAGGNPAIHRRTVEIRLATDNSPLLPGTKCLLLLGEATLPLYKNDVTLNEQRGAPFMWKGIPCIASYAPQDANDRRDYYSNDDEEETEYEKGETAEGKTTHGFTQRKNWRFWCRQDIKKAAQVTTRGLTTHSPNVHLWPNFDEVIALLTTRKGEDFFFDIETDSNLQITCFGFTFTSIQKDIYVVPMLQTQISPPIYHYSETYKILRALSTALRNNRVVIHNASFDLFVLAWRYGIPPSSRVFDTLLSHNRCYIEVEKSLGHCLSLYTDLPYHKNEGIFEPHNLQQTNQLYEYNAKDVYALTQLKPAIEVTAQRLGATESVEQVNRMVVPYLTLTLQGIKLDTKRIEEIVTYHERYNLQILRLLRLLTGQEFNPLSWQQVSKYLYENPAFKIPKPENDPTNEKTLLQLLLKYDVPAIHCILKFRGNQKRISKAAVKTKRSEPRYYFGVFSKESNNPRITTQWRLGKTVTMRLGSSKLLRRWGDNLQNWEVFLRKEIVPDEGKCFLQPDQSGAEALIVAFLCRPGNYRDIFLYGINPHCFLALHIFTEQFQAELGFGLKHYTELPARLLAKEKQWPEIAKCTKASDEWPAERRYYFMAKQGNHSLNYDAKARAFRLNTLQKSDGAVALTLPQAQRIIDVRSGLFPEIAAWQRDVVMEVKRTSMLRNLFGHPRVFTGFIDESMYKEMYAFVPQSTVGQITNYAIVELQERIERGDPLLHNVDLLQNNHDSLLEQCPTEQRVEVARETRKHINRELTSPRGEKFTMKSDMKWSDKSWGEMQPLEI